MSKVAIEKTNKFKEFTLVLNGEDIPLKMKHPNQEELLEMDIRYRKIFAMAVRDGIMTHAELVKQAIKTGAWTDEDEATNNHTMIEIALLEEVIRDGEKKHSDDEKRDAALKATKLRTKAIKGMNTKAALFDQAAEGLAEEQKMHKYVQLCTVHQDSGQRFFSDEDEYKEFLSEHRDEGSLLFRNAYYFQYNLPEDMSADWAEIQYLNAEAQRIGEEVKEDMKAIDEAEKVVEDTSEVIEKAKADNKEEDAPKEAADAE